MSCPACGINVFTNDCPLQHGNPHENTGVYKNTCINGHKSFFNEKTKRQTKTKPRQQ